MGSIWLGSLPDVLRQAGLDVSVYPGWETRSRSSGGYDALLGIQIHHTASSGLNPAAEMNWMWNVSGSRPVGALYLDTAGRWTVGAAGATNTSGRGGPIVTSRGVIPLDAANRYVISIEAANRGDGTPWPEAQQKSYVKGVAALNKAYFNGVLNEVGDVHGHFEWTTRKIDPAGQSKYATGSAKWNMHQFRSDVAITNAVPPTQPGGEMEVTYDDPIRLIDSRKWPGVKLSGVHTFGVPQQVPTDATTLEITLTAVDADGPGFITLWSGKSGDKRPTASKLNWDGKVPYGIANSTKVKIHNRAFKIYFHVPTHVVVDVDGHVE